MSLKALAKADLVAISGGIDITDPNFSVEQFVKYCKLVVDNFNNTQENTNEQTLDSCAVISS